MERHHVAALVGYPSAIHFLARLCSDLCMSPALKAVLTTSETISPGVRETIERAFGCQVFDFYGAAERVCYIFTCDHGRYHVQSEYGLTEFLPMTGEYAGTARIVATGFWNLATPLIRYDTQDLVETATGDCPCGRQSPLVKKISGRTGDLVITPSGKHFAPTLMSSVSRQGRNILQTQIIQDRIDHLLITYVPSSRFTSADLREFQANMRSSLPSELTLDFRSVTRVEATSSGKTNLVISRIKERADQ